ncbi:MAG: DeoR/GlpR transcriptional regulator, partial [Bacilli bacterium]|nr:DeoR/GlpR transcriptional regulator [Bacilli bacterium]
MEYVERSTQIIEYLKAEKYISYKELAKRLYTSEATIRRDCKKIVEKMHIKIVKNGVMFADGSSTEYSLLIRQKVNEREKESIAKLASEFLYDGISCFIDGSTTAGMLVPYFKDLTNVTVVTNNLDNALRLNYNTSAKIYLAGGLLSKDNNSAQSLQAIDFLNRFSADVAFVSAKGIDKNGYTSEALDEVKG